MKTKIETVIEKVETSSNIANEKKTLIIEKLHEWKNEKNIINDVAIRFENYWLEVEPIFAEMGWV